MTRKDAFPLPRCKDLLNAAGKGTLRFITKLDLKMGFHQVLLSEKCPVEKWPLSHQTANSNTIPCRIA